ARSGSATGSLPPSPVPSRDCSLLPTFLLPATNWPPGASTSARCSTSSTVHGRPDLTRPRQLHVVRRVQRPRQQPVAAARTPWPAAGASSWTAPPPPRG